MAFAQLLDPHVETQAGPRDDYVGPTPPAASKKLSSLQRSRVPNSRVKKPDNRKMEEITVLEAAIPPHLEVERTQPLSKPDDFQVPPYPAYSTRFSKQFPKLATVDIGIQALPGTDISSAVQTLTAAFDAPHGPGHIIKSFYLDGKGFNNTVFTAYWADAEEYDKWQQSTGKGWWYAGLALTGSIGVFMEAYTISINDIETIFSRLELHGFARVAESMSAPIDTHGYSGGMRDRIPRAQHDPLLPDGYPSVANCPAASIGAHIVVRPHGNLCVIRSGQDWGDCDEVEAGWYTSRMQPHLNRAMEDIVQNWGSKGCFSSRFMNVGEEETQDITETWNISAWMSLAHLESWNKTPIHKPLLETTEAYAKKFGSESKLVLWHEVMVVEEGGQSFEYYNCHDGTGLLAAIYH